MPLLGQQVATEPRRRAFVEYLRQVGDGIPCITWPWSKRAPGTETYIRISDGNGGTNSAHRWVWEQLHGPIPADLEVCHNCPGGDNPACCRPSHLWLGSHSDNIKDAYAKGRMHGNTKNHPTGEKHHATVLSEAQVFDIRRRAKGRNQSALAREFGVSHATINKIVHRHIWKHLPEEQPLPSPAVQALD